MCNISTKAGVPNEVATEFIKWKNISASRFTAIEVKKIL